MDEIYFEYSENETNYLTKRDPILGEAIGKIGHIHRAITPDIFTALVDAIVGQQISTKAKSTVWARITAAFSPMTPATIASATAEELQKCGISFRKADYIKEIADAVISGSLNLSALQTQSDDEVRARLSQLRGIGEWTADMLMTFSMGRADIISFDDLGILRGMRMLYRHKRITPKLFAKYKCRYSPFATAASLYLWAISSGACPELTDPAPKAKSKK